MSIPPGPGPELTPDEALRRAHAWWQAAAASSGPHRAEAERAAAYWSAQHRTLLERAHAPAYAAAPAPAYAAPAPPYGSPAPAYGSPAYGSPEPAWQVPPAPRRRRGLRAGRVVTVGIVLCVAVVTSVVTGLRDRAEGGWGRGEVVGLPTEQEGAVPPPTVWEDPSPDAAPSSAGMEARWRAGDFAGTLPDPVPGATQTTPFLPDHPDPTDWVVALNPANEGISVVFTDDPTLNCGMAHVEEHDAYEGGYAGCFQPAHPTVLFVWWDDDAVPAAKQILLAHELSHMIQWWHEFDLLQSAYDAGLGEDEEWEHALETDATCRVLSWGGYSEAAADRTSSPCDTDDWSPTWLADRAADLGVVVRDY